MIYPRVKLDEWLKLHPELTLQSKNCDACGKEMFKELEKGK